MRCRLCGKQIKSGTFCDECIREGMQNKKDDDKKILIKINRKFLPSYQIWVNWELLLLSFIILLYSIALKKISFIIASVIFDIILIFGALIINKRIAIGTKCIFYENKIVYKFDFLFIHKKIEYHYSDIQDIVYNQKFLQKRFKLGNIAVVAKKTGFLYRGVVISDVANISETFDKLVSMVGTKIV